MIKNKENISKNKMILIGSIVIILLAIAIIALTIYKQHSKEEFKIDGIDVTKNEEILKDKVVKVLSIQNQVMYTRDNSSIYSAIISNQNDKDINIKSLFIIFKIDNEELRIELLNNAIIKANDKTTVSINFDADINKITNIDFELEYN